MILKLLWRTVDRPLVAWAVTLAWMILVLVLMLLPGEESIAEDTSRFFGGTDLTDAAGHLLLFGGLALLFYRSLGFHVAGARRFRLSVGIVFALGTCLELAQVFVPHRGVTLLDLSANWIGVLIAGVWARSQQ